jgi:hypothetical protein
MTGREPKENNDIFFVCSLIEYIARQTKNHRSVVVNAIGKNKLQHIYDLADIYHSENIDKLADELICSTPIQQGNFDNVVASNYAVPTLWDIGKVFNRLIMSIRINRNSNDSIGVLIEVYNSWITRKIEDFNSSMYYENPDYIFQSYLNGEVLA